MSNSSLKANWHRTKAVVLSAAALLLVLFASQAHADSVFVQPPLAEGEEAGLKASVYELVKAAVSNESGYSLASSAKEAEFTLRSRVLKLGNSYIMSVDKIKGEKVLFTSKMKASSAEDLDTVSARVVRSALNETRAEGNAQVDDVTEDEVTRGTRRQQATRQWKLGFGPAWGANLNTDKNGLLFNVGFVWGLDAHWDLDFGFKATGIDNTGTSAAYFTEFMLGANYHLTKNKTAPFITFGVGRASAGVAQSDTFIFTDDTANGWALRAGAGVKLFRTSTVNLGLEANHTILMAKTSRTDKNPGVTSFVVALYY
jgi:hypothetical protein